MEETRNKKLFPGGGRGDVFSLPFYLLLLLLLLPLLYLAAMTSSLPGPVYGAGTCEKGGRVDIHRAE